MTRPSKVFTTFIFDNSFPNPPTPLYLSKQHLNQYLKSVRHYFIRSVPLPKAQQSVNNGHTREYSSLHISAVAAVKGQRRAITFIEAAIAVRYRYADTFTETATAVRWRSGFTAAFTETAVRRRILLTATDTATDPSIKIPITHLYHGLVDNTLEPSPDHMIVTS
jgi:hypothetical protein